MSNLIDEIKSSTRKLVCNKSGNEVDATEEEYYNDYLKYGTQAFDWHYIVKENKLPA
jgi:hypothetical protein